MSSRLKAANPGNTALRRRVLGIVRRFSGRVGVAARNLTTGQSLDINATELFPTLSTIRVPIMAELFFQAHERVVDLGEKLTVRREDVRGGTGVLKELTMPVDLTLRDLCMLMVKESDNTATWLIVNRLGRDNINRRMRSLGLSQVELRSDLSAQMFEVIRKQDIDSVAVSSPRDLTELMCMIARLELVSRQASHQMLEILRRCMEPDFLGRYLPVDQLPEDTGAKPEATLANKTGSFLHGRTDVGLIETANARYVVTAMTAYSNDPSLRLFVHEGVETIGRISRAIFEAWTRPH